MITIGADPELFLFRKDGNVASAIGVVGGSKRRPKKLSDHIKVQEDNVLAEFNITPANSKAEFVSFCLEGLNEVAKLVEPKGYDVRVLASCILPPEELANPKAYVFGCDPDFNAWTMQMNAPPTPIENLRSAGGHIHVGGIKQGDVINTIRAMDLFLGVPSVLMDTDTKRRALYGKAGAFRYKKYGAEYRTLSNFWLQEESLIEWAYDSTMKAVEWASNNKILDTDLLARRIVSTINFANKYDAQKLMKEFNLG